MKCQTRSCTVYLLALACAAKTVAAPISSEEAVGRARAWMQGHPIMGVAATRAVQSVTAFPADTPPECVHVVELSQGGYLVLAADDRLAPVIAFDAVSAVNLEDRPDNAFRAFLLHYAEELPAKLDALPDVPFKTHPFVLLSTPAQYGPYTETGWTQWHPYNLYCPAGGVLNGYQGRVPVGCTPVTWAQVMGYHRWPLHGQGTHTYTDSSGLVTGTHSVDFSEPIAWDNMLNVYNSSVSPYQQGQEDIAALMYKLGVAADINYEGDGSAASILTLGNRVRDHLFFDTFTYFSSATPAFYTAMNDDLCAGYPCIVGIPGHAVVVDGLLADGVSENYHINYGWAGNNDGWFTGGSVPGGAIQYGVTRIRPRLFAIPCGETVAATNGTPFTFEWVLPRRRSHEALAIHVQRLDKSTGTWVNFAQDFALNAYRCEKTSTMLDDFEDLTTFFQPDGPGTGVWLVTSVDDVPNCAYLDVSSTGGFKTRMLRSMATITPSVDSVLAIRWKRYIASPMHVEVSASSAGPWTQIASFNDRAPWQTEYVPLDAYAGQPIYLRINPLNSLAYSDGGIWIDFIALLDVTNPQYEKQPVHHTELTTSLVGSHTLRAVVEDFNHVMHDPGPEFTLVVSPGALPPDALRITGFSFIGNGQFALAWEFDPALQNAVFDVVGSVMLPATNGWHKESPVTLTPNSAIFAPASNRFFRVRAQ